MLRAATWLAPGLPLDLFEVVTDALATAIGTTGTVESFTDASGPSVDDNPFARDELDIGFMCTPSYRTLAAQTPPTIRLIGAAPVFDDVRNGGRPVYFAELIAGATFSGTSIAELAGARIGYNDEHSMSGRVALQARLEELGLDESFASFVRTGSHHASLDALAAGRIEAASIDSNTLLTLSAPPAGVRVIETLGPYPVQPVVARASLTDKTREVITGTLLSLHDLPETAQELRRHHVERFAPVTEDDYR